MAYGIFIYQRRLYGSNFACSSGIQVRGFFYKSDIGIAIDMTLIAM